MIDESKLRPFDLEAAKRGEKVVRNLEGAWKEVIAGAWERDWIRCYCCLILDAEGDRVWLITSDADLRMAPKTKTVWYALLAGAMFVLEFVLGDDKTFARVFLIAAGVLSAITAAAYFGQKLI